MLAVGLLAALAACGDSKDEDDPAAAGGNGEADPEIAGNRIVTVDPDRQKLLRNPLTGWVVYGSTGVDGFWEKYDEITVPQLMNPVRISDYAHTLYLRCSWTQLNPKEGVYGWDTDEKLKSLLTAARQRGMRLAFRVVIDSRDKSEDFTPAYVRQAGAAGFTSGSNNARWSPYPDDPIFQEKYGRFIEDFAQKFNDPEQVDFIDGFGLGKWGEAHSMIYRNSANREAVFRWVVDLYARCFTRIVLAINYHRLIGTEKDWGAADADSERLLEYAFGKGYVLRHDAFGMTDYYQQWERTLAAKWNFTRPVIMEGGWVTGQHSYWNDPRAYATVGAVRQGEFDDSSEARVNMMDFRIGETQSWFTNCYDLVRRFIAEGGYRLYPDRLSLPAEIRNGATLTIVHQWQNLGWGYCPTNLPQWNQKYKVAFALLDNSQQPAALFVDPQTDLSRWIRGVPTSYRFTLQPAAIPPGAYTWAVAIVDTTRNNVRGIDLAVKKNLTTTGWLRLMDVNLK
jgi:hypothetical protein